MIKLYRGGRFAPGCYIIARQRADGSFDMHDEASTVLVQLDYDRPAVARAFGWSGQTPGLICDHEGTDGTIDCPACGRTALALIGDATDWLDEHDGAEAQDPGYFAD